MNPLEKSKQKIPTNRNDSGDYSGEYRGYTFDVWFSHGWWEAEVNEIDGPESKISPQERKADAVNVIKEKIDRKKAN